MKLLYAATAFLLLPLPSTGWSQSEVEPGVRLLTMVTAVEHSADGPKVTKVQPTAIASNLHTGSNVARGLVYSGQHHSIELPGVASTTVLTSTSPVFYVHMDPDSPDDTRSMITLIALKPGKDARLVLNMTSNTFGGGRKRKMDEVAVTKTEVKGVWLKIVPTVPLPPGEYGLMFLPKDPDMFADRVYDFSVVPK